VEVTVISNEECNDHYPGKIERYQNTDIIIVNFATADMMVN